VFAGKAAYSVQVKRRNFRFPFRHIALESYISAM